MPNLWHATKSATSDRQWVKCFATNVRSALEKHVREYSNICLTMHAHMFGVLLWKGVIFSKIVCSKWPIFDCGNKIYFWKKYMKRGLFMEKVKSQLRVYVGSQPCFCSADRTFVAKQMPKHVVYCHAETDKTSNTPKKTALHKSTNSCILNFSQPTRIFCTYFLDQFKWRHLRFLLNWCFKIKNLWNQHKSWAPHKQSAPFNPPSLNFHRKNMRFSIPKWRGYPIYFYMPFTKTCYKLREHECAWSMHNHVFWKQTLKKRDFLRFSFMWKFRFWKFIFSERCYFEHERWFFSICLDEFLLA